MQNLTIHDPTALQLLMTDDIYIISEKQQEKQQQAIEVPVNNTLEKTPINDEVAEAGAYTGTANSSSKVFTYLGENNKYFLILTDDKTHKEVNKIHLEMLLKIMQAKGLELRDLAIVNLNNYPGASFSDLKAFFGCNRLTLFGISPLQISLKSLTANQPEKQDEVKILATYSLEEMINDIDKKKQFWNVMKSF